MKHPLLLIFVFVVSGFCNSFAQGISPELLNVVNRLPSNQRNLVINQYERLNRFPGTGRTSFANEVKPVFMPPGVEASGDVVASDQLPDLRGDEYRTKLKLLEELETMIEDDITANNLEIKKADEDPASVSLIDENALEDRKNDLRRALGEIRRLQLSVIAEEISGLDAAEDTELLPFGYGAFNKSPNLSDRFGFYGVRSQVSAIPPDYKVGSGDYLDIQLYGQNEAQYSVVIGRNGILQFPGIGPLNILEQGNSFQSLKSLIKEKVREQLGEGVRVSVSLAELRQIRVFLAGEFIQPGRRLVTAGSSLFTLLMDSGGVNRIASLRSLKLKRSGSPDRVFDLYDLLIKGERTEAKLEDGDVIFLPTVKNRVWVHGNVLRPAVYELTSESTLSDAIELSGGFSERGMFSAINLERKEDSDDAVSFKTLNFAQDADFPLKNGDRLEVRRVSQTNRLAIELAGEVEHPGIFEWKSNIRISKILKSISFFKKDADLTYALIRRQDRFGRISSLSFSPKEIFSSPDSAQDLILQPGDQLIVLTRVDKLQRERMIRPLLKELRQEGKPGLGGPSVRISGVVHLPGEYPYIPGMTVGDLIVAGGGMAESAYTVSAELTRQSVDLNSTNPKALITHDTLASMLSEETLSTRLRPRDILSIKPIPSWSEQNNIEIQGEVRFPGVYTFQKNETLKSVFKRAGGFTQEAFPQGAVFTRLNLMQREEEQKKRLITQLETDVANLSLAAGSEETATKAKSVADGLLTKLKNTKSTGRLVIDLGKLVSGKDENSIVVRNGDKLVVPSIPYEVSVVGEVQFATSHLFDAKLNMKDYIYRSGGFTANADQGRVFAVKANGSVLTKSNTGWFKTAKTNGMLEAGDVVVVPINLEKGRWLETLTSGTQVVYQLAVAAAAVNSF